MRKKVCQLRLGVIGQLCLEYVEEKADTELATLVKEYAELKQQLDEIKARLDNVREQLIELLGEGEHEVGGYKVKIAKVSRKCLDVKKVKALLTELGLLNNFVKETEAVYVTVRRCE